MTGTEVDTSLHGAPTWFETLTTDTDRAGKFYSDLFGWSTQVQRMPGFDYTSFLHRRQPNRRDDADYP
jgi:predicted enzyme related to lactoylglutathione lyase